MIVRDIVEDDGDFCSNLTRAIQEACHTTEIIKSQKELLQQERDLKKKEEEEYLKSVYEDRQKQDQGQQAAGCYELEETVVDTAEVRKRQIERLKEQAHVTKRFRGDNNDDEDDAVVTFKKK